MNKFFLNHKFGPLLLGLLIVIITFSTITLIKHIGYGIVYQTTGSVPRGLYLLTPHKRLKRNDMVAFIPPPKTEKFLLKKHWVPKSGVIFKYIVGLPGDHACTLRHNLWLNGKPLGPIFKFYAPGKPLPRTHFCGTLKPNEFFLMSKDIKRSFDSRYFGPITKKQIHGKVFPLFTITSKQAKE